MGENLDKKAQKKATEACENFVNFLKSIDNLQKRQFAETNGLVAMDRFKSFESKVDLLCAVLRQHYPALDEGLKKNCQPQQECESESVNVRQRAQVRGLPPPNKMQSASPLSHESQY